jgi:hypothetical protein
MKYVRRVDFSLGLATKTEGLTTMNGEVGGYHLACHGTVRALKSRQKIGIP